MTFTQHEDSNRGIATILITVEPMTRSMCTIDGSTAVIKSVFIAPCTIDTLCIATTKIVDLLTSIMRNLMVGVRDIRIWYIVLET